VPEHRLPLPSRPCPECGAERATDQRYCLSCGTRLDALPPEIAQLLGLPAPERFVGMADAPPAPARRQLSPRVAALAVLATLAFGSVLGTVISPAASSLASAPVVVAMAPPAATAAVAQPTAGDRTPPADTGSSATPDASGDDTSATSDDTSATDDTTPADSGDSGPTAPGEYAPPKIKHVFLIVLHGHGYEDAFGGSSKAPYLSQTLPRQGELVQNYYGATQGELANGIALLSGQGPTAQTQANCPTYADVTPATTGDDGQVLGDGCVYPAATRTLPDQLAKAGRTWKAYVEDVGNGPVDQATTCRHPTLGAADPLQAPRPGDAYETYRNPFIYFHSLTDGTACANGDVGLGQLTLDLTSADTTPAFSYIVPNACHDGTDTACATGQPAGMKAADDWLKTIVPAILRSKAYADGGLLAITFDQAPQTGATPDASQCCTPAAFPNLPSVAAPATTATPASTATPATSVLPATTATTSAPATTTDPAASTGAPASTATPAATGVLPDDGSSPGGGKVGMLLLSDAVKAGSSDVIDSFNHFAFLKSVEDLFGLDHLGYADDPAMPAFGKAVYTNSFRK
jgi:hypothetical protein